MVPRASVIWNRMPHVDSSRVGRQARHLARAAGTAPDNATILGNGQDGLCDASRRTRHEPRAHDLAEADRWLTRDGHDGHPAVPLSNDRTVAGNEAPRCGDVPCHARESRQAGTAPDVINLSVGTYPKRTAARYRDRVVVAVHA